MYCGRGPYPGCQPQNCFLLGCQRLISMIRLLVCASCCSIYGRQVPAAALVLRLSPHPVACSICYSSYELRLHCSLSDEWTSGMRRPHPAQVNNPSCCRLLWAPWPTERWWGALPLGRSSASSGTTTGRRSSR